MNVVLSMSGAGLAKNFQTEPALNSSFVRTPLIGTVLAGQPPSGSPNSGLVFDIIGATPGEKSGRTRARRTICQLFI